MSDSAAVFEAAERDAIETDNTWPCGWGGSPRCQTRIHFNGLCSVHQIAIREAWTRASGMRKKGAAKAEKEGRESYRDRTARVAAERREAWVTKITAHVLAVGGPVSRSSLAEEVGVANGSALGDAIKLAVERDGLFTTGRSGPLALRGLWVSEEAHAAAVAARDEAARPSPPPRSCAQTAWEPRAQTAWEPLTDEEATAVRAQIDRDQEPISATLATLVTPVDG